MVNFKGGCLTQVLLYGVTMSEGTFSHVVTRTIYSLPRNEPAHNKTYNKTCVTSKDTNQSVHPLSMARVLIYSSLDSLEVVESTCNQQRLIGERGCKG